MTSRPGRRVGRAARLHADGVAAIRHMRPAVAARRLRSALVLLSSEGTGDAPLRGRVLVSLAYAEAEQGHTELALRLLGEAEPLLPPAERGVLYGQWGLLLRRTGRDAQALTQYDAAIGLIREQAEPEELARVLLNRGALHLAAVNVRAARADLRRCAQLAARYGFTGLSLKARHNLAYVDFLTGDLPSALREYGALAPEYAATMPGVLPYLAMDRARTLLAAGLFGEADHELAQALDGFGRQRLSQDYAEAQLARAEAALLAGYPVVARRWAVRARARFTRRDNVRWAAVASLVALRGDLSAGRTLATVATSARTLAKDLRTLGFADDARLADVLAARASTASGRVGEAAADLARPRAPGRLDARLQWRLARAEVAHATGRPADGSRELSRGLAELHRYRARLGGLDLRTGLAVHGRELAATGLRWAVEAGRPADVYRWAERARAQALLLPPVRPPDDPEAAAALDELRAVRHALREGDVAGRPVAALRARADALQRTVRERAWYADGTGTAVEPASFATVRAELGATALVTYVSAGDTLFALVVVSQKAAVVRLGAYPAAQEALRRLRADLDARAGRALPERLAATLTAATARDAGVLADLLFAPLAGLVGDRPLVVVPTGVLITVPWGLLPGTAGRAVAVAPSATTWLAARHRSRPSTGGALLVSGPGNERGDAEVAAIAALRPQSTVLSGPSATPAATLAGLAGVDVAHLAAHGHHEPDNPLFSALDLAGGPLMGYDLPRAGGVPGLVVLSSCEVGLADVRPGDESLGLTTALLAAGARTVVASVSRVDDASAMAVMTRYHRVVCAGASPAYALADASTVDSSTAFVCFGAG